MEHKVNNYEKIVSIRFNRLGCLFFGGDKNLEDLKDYDFTGLFEEYERIEKEKKREKINLETKNVLNEWEKTAMANGLKYDKDSKGTISITF